MARHWDHVLGYAMRMLGNVDAAEDIAQEVFVSVWEHRRRWTPEGSARGYLFRIARNRALHRTRHEDVRSRSEPDIRALSPTVRTPEEHAIVTQRWEALENVLASFPERRREAFILVRIHGLSLAETSEIMGVTHRTITNHLYIATRALEEALRPSER